MIWPFREASSNGWQRLARGADIPAKPGQKVDLRFEDRREVYGIVAGQSGKLSLTDGHTLTYKTGQSLTAWQDVKTRKPCLVTHYRPHKPVEISEESAARAHRKNTFRDLLDPARKIPEDAAEEPKRQPVKVRP